MDTNLTDIVKYITKVMLSCRNIKQLDSAYQWGMNVLKMRAMFRHKKTNPAINEAARLTSDLYTRMTVFI